MFSRHINPYEDMINTYNSRRITVQSGAIIQPDTRPVLQTPRVKPKSKGDNHVNPSEVDTIPLESLGHITLTDNIVKEGGVFIDKKPMKEPQKQDNTMYENIRNQFLITPRKNKERYIKKNMKHFTKMDIGKQQELMKLYYDHL